MCVCLHAKGLLFMPGFKGQNISTNFSKNQALKFHKNMSHECCPFSCGRTDLERLIFTFRNCLRIGLHCSWTCARACTVIN